MTKEAGEARKPPRSIEYEKLVAAVRSRTPEIRGQLEALNVVAEHVGCEEDVHTLISAVKEQLAADHSDPVKAFLFSYLAELENVLRIVQVKKREIASYDA